jgi:hypothetical protein
MSSREKRPFWYFATAIGVMALAAGWLAPGGAMRRYELAGGLAVFLLSLARLFFLRSRRRRRRRRMVKRRVASAQPPPPAA